MLAFESLTPEGLLKEVAEYIRQAAARAGAEVARLDRTPKADQTRHHQNGRNLYHRECIVLTGIAHDLEGAAILPAASPLRDQPLSEIEKLLAEHYVRKVCQRDR